MHFPCSSVPCLCALILAAASVLLWTLSCSRFVCDDVQWNTCWQGTARWQVGHKSGANERASETRGEWEAKCSSGDGLCVRPGLPGWLSVYAKVYCKSKYYSFSLAPAGQTPCFSLKINNSAVHVRGLGWLLLVVAGEASIPAWMGKRKGGRDEVHVHGLGSTCIAKPHSSCGFRIRYPLFSSCVPFSIFPLFLSFFLSILHIYLFCTFISFFLSFSLYLSCTFISLADVGTSSPVDFILEDFASSNFQTLQVSF